MTRPARPRPTRTRAAVGIAQKLTGIDVMHIHTEGPAPHLAPEAAGTFRDYSFFTGGNARAAINAGRADYVPIFLSEIPLLFRRGLRPVDVALISVSPPDEHGFCSLGPSVDVTRSALQAAKVVVALVNNRVPRVFGDGEIHVSNIDFVYRHDAPLHARAARESTPVEEAIGKLIATELVRDGATLQLGIGAIPDSTLEYCAGHKDLGVHSEMYSDGVMALIDAGVVTGRHKTSEAGKLTGGFAFGSSKLYDWMHDNAGIVMLDIACASLRPRGRAG